MRLLLMADTHGRTDYPISLVEYDLLIHAGDLTRLGELDELEEQARWLAGVWAKRRIVIAGNHDLCFQDERREAALAIFERHDITYLEDSGVEVNGLKIWGTPWTPTFGDWAFMEEEDILAEKFALIPLNTDILVSHGPPMGIGGMTSRGDEAGSSALLDAVCSVRPALMVNGHIHEAHGARKVAWGGVVINASCGSYGSRWRSERHQRGAPVVIEGVGI